MSDKMDVMNVFTNIPPAIILDRQWNSVQYEKYCPKNLTVDEFRNYITFLREDCRIPICTIIYKDNSIINKVGEDVIYFRLYLETKKDIIITYFQKKYL